MRTRLGSFVALALSATLVGAGGASAAGQPKSIWFEDSGARHADGTGAHNDSAQKLLHARNAASSLAPAAASADVGDVAVVVDNGSMFIQPRPGSPLDLALPATITFTPAGGGNYTVASAPFTFDSSAATPLLLGDDDTTNIALPFSFPFVGASYADAWVNSDGNVTFGAGDSASTARDGARHVGGPPRVSALLNDLNRETGGSITFATTPTKLVVTWTDVPEFDTVNSNTFQVVLHSSGAITLSYQSLDAQFGVIGIAEGADEGPFNEIDLTADLPFTGEAGAIFEEFFAPIAMKQWDVIATAREFYRTHGDKYDYLVMFSDSIVDIGSGAFAYHLGVKNQTSGFGRPTFDFSAVAGSGGELESILNMNRIGLYWPDANKLVDPPIKKFRFSSLVPGATLDGPPGAEQISRRARWMGTLNGDFGVHGSYTLGLNSAMSIMGQEAGHRWLAFTNFVDPVTGVQSDELLGRSLAHWSFFFDVTVPPSQFGGDARASSAEGNAIVDEAGPCAAPGQTRFRNARNELIDGFTRLDQYLMGLIPASEVGPFWFYRDPTSPSTGAPRPPSLRSAGAQDDVLSCGKKVTLDVGDIQAAEGPRVPAIGDEVDTVAATGAPALDHKTMAFVLVVEQGAPDSPAHAAAIRQVATFARTWESYANGPATNGLGRFETSLSPSIH